MRPFPEQGHQRNDVGRTLLEQQQFAVAFAPAGRIDVDEIGLSLETGDEPFRLVADHLDVVRAEPLEIMPGDAGQFLVVFDGHDPVETAREMERIDAQPAGQVDAEFSAVAFGPCRAFAAGLFEGERRQDAAGAVVGRQFGPCPLQVFDLGGDRCAVLGQAQRHPGRIFVDVAFDKASRFVEEQDIRFSGCHDKRTFMANIR